MGERHSEYERNGNDWYVEPAFTVERLLDRYPQVTALHDPCCGIGTIVDTAMARGIRATGSDLVDRADGRFIARDFLTCDRPERSIVTNPPFKIGEKIVRHAMTVVDPGGIVAVIAQAKFLFSQGRHSIFSAASMERVIIFSRRPNMPPGEMLMAEGEDCRGGGSIDFCWCVWRKGKAIPGAVIEWTM